MIKMPSQSDLRLKALYLKGSVSMKKYILSPLCSGLVIPGLGQILNRQNAKGLIILAIIFILFISMVVNLFLVVRSLAPQAGDLAYHSGDILERIRHENVSFFVSVFLAFTVVWVYSVVDAFWIGLKIERYGKDGAP